MAETFTNSTVKLTTLDATDIYQAPTGNAADRAVVLSCMVANGALFARDVIIVITDATNNVLSTLIHNVTVPTKATLEAIPNKVILKQSQKLRATSNEPTGIEITVSALEVVS